MREFAPRYRELLAKRDELQQQLDAWHRAHRDQSLDLAAYRAFLTEIGYLLPEGPDFSINTNNVDPKIAIMPVPNSWCPSATPAMRSMPPMRAGETSTTRSMAPTPSPPRMRDWSAAPSSIQGAAVVIERAAAFLDEAAPLNRGSHADACGYKLENGKLVVLLPDNSETLLVDPAQCVGFRGKPDQLEAVLLVNHGLHIEIQIDCHHPISAGSAAGIADILLEAAVTSIQDCEDSVAAVDPEDKVTVYQHVANWLHHGVVSESQVMETLKRMAPWSISRTQAIPSIGRWCPDSTAWPFRPPVI
ncbi:MAG: hypothetical protein ACUVT0_10970 [Thermochromatium sp.]